MSFHISNTLLYVQERESTHVMLCLSPNSFNFSNTQNSTLVTPKMKTQQFWRNWSFYVSSSFSWTCCSQVLSKRYHVSCFDLFGYQRTTRCFSPASPIAEKRSVIFSLKTTKGVLLFACPAKYLIFKKMDIPNIITLSNLKNYFLSSARFSTLNLAELRK